jgi:aldehyde dehydrogenase (NAD+)
MAIPAWKSMPALICGNTVVIKPATDTPASVANMVRVMAEEGIPPGVMNMVTGSGSAVGQPLIKDDRVRVISFTGSTAVGRKVSESCAPNFKHACLEMGGKNVQIVMDDADLELAVEGALWGAFGTTGQRCTATSRLICHKDVVKKVTDMMVKRAEGLKVGNGLDEKVQMGPVINQDQLDTVLKYIEIGHKEDGANMVCGGERLTGGDYDKGYFVKPTIFTEVTQKMRIWREEIFGPVLSIGTFSTFEEAVEMANDTAYGLSASIYTNDIRKAYTAMRDVYTGIFYVNAPTIGAETHLPFGGTKETGNGHREAAMAALDVFSEWKSVYVDFSGGLQRAQIDNQ